MTNDTVETNIRYETLADIKNRPSVQLTVGRLREFLAQNVDLRPIHPFYISVLKTVILQRPRTTVGN